MPEIFPWRRRGTSRNTPRQAAGQPASQATGRAAGRVETKALLADLYERMTVEGWDRRVRDWGMDRAVAEGYERMVWVYRPVRYLSGWCARAEVPIRLATGPSPVLGAADPASADYDDADPLVGLLNGQANPLETGLVFRQRLASQILLSRRGAFVEVTTSSAGTPVRLDLLPPGRTRLVPGRGGDLVDHIEVTLLSGGLYQLDPDRVRWFRDPHPTDPYSGMTPLEAAGLSVELDYYARLMNVSFMRNDGRPGGIIGVEGDLNDADLSRIEARFNRGPLAAGELAAIAGEVSFVDTSATPRDSQYQQASANAKLEMLAAFGLGEAALGSSAERTYSNAETETYNALTGPVADLMSIISSGFDQDTTDARRLIFDVSSVPAMQVARRQALEIARQEVAAGLRSPWSYAQLAGIREFPDNAFTRAVYIPQGGRIPVPLDEQDAAILGAPPMNTAATGGDPAGGALPAPDSPGQGLAADPGSANSAAPAATPPAPADTPQDSTGSTAADPTITPSLGQTSAADEVKALLAAGPPSARARARPAAGRAFVTRPDLDGLTTQLAADLAARAEGWTARAAARLNSPRARSGTRHWTPDPTDPATEQAAVAPATGGAPALKALDLAYAIDADTWATDTADLVRPAVETAALTAAAAWLSGVTAAKPGAVTGDALAEALRTNTPGTTQPAADSTAGTPAGVVAAAVIATGLGVAALAAVASAAIRAASAAVPIAVAAATRQAKHLLVALSTADTRGDNIRDLTGLVTGARDRLGTWARAVADATLPPAAAAAEDAAARVATDDPAARVTIRREWRSERDAKVRPTHQAADGQQRDLESPFTVGGSLLRFPRDPLGPPHEVINCRCDTVWHIATEALPLPAGQATA